MDNNTERVAEGRKAPDAIVATAFVSTKRVEAFALTAELAHQCLRGEAALPWGLRVSGSHHPQRNQFYYGHVSIEQPNGTYDAVPAGKDNWIVRDEDGHMRGVGDDLFQKWYDIDPLPDLLHLADEQAKVLEEANRSLDLAVMEIETMQSNLCHQCARDTENAVAEMHEVLAKEQPTHRPETNAHE